MSRQYYAARANELRRAKLPAGTRFVMTNEFRFPLAGEWFLSGGIPEAYYAYNNGRNPYHILRPLLKLPVEHPHYKPT